MSVINDEAARIGPAIPTLAALLSIIDAARAAMPGLDPACSTDLGTALSEASRAARAARTVAALADALASCITVLRDLGRASSDPATSAPAWAAAQDASAALQLSSRSPATRRATGLPNAVAALGEGACLGEWAVATAQVEYSDRPSALAAKAALSDRAGPTLERVARLAGQAPWRLLSRAVEQSAAHLSRRSLDLRPVVLVTTARSLPATALAWSLYGDPSRAADLVSRNRVGTPAFMPVRFEALAP